MNGIDIPCYCMIDINYYISHFVFYDNHLTRIEVGHAVDPFAAHAALAVYAPSWLLFARIPHRVSPVVDAQPLTWLSGSTYREVIRHADHPARRSPPAR